MRGKGTFVRRFFRVIGCSWKGNVTLRNGKSVHCGHEHQDKLTADSCCKDMRNNRPGKCQDYLIMEIEIYERKVVKP